MNRQLISVIIPAYNVSGYIENCLNSVLNQTYDNIEIIVVDDGSVDDTGSIVDNYQALYPDRVKAIHTENRGVTSARFEGVLASNGDWIGFVDGDDEIEPDMYERLHNNAVKYVADISHCGHKTIVNGGERVHEFYNTGKLIKQNNKEGIRDLLNGQFEPSLCTKLFHKDLVFKVVKEDVLSPDIKYNEDVLMNYYLFKAANNTILEDFCGYHYIARTNSVTRNTFNVKKVIDPVIVRQLILDDITDDFKDIAERNYLTACIRACEVLYKKTEYINEYNNIYTKLKTNRDKWSLLRRNDRIKLFLLMRSPALYIWLYEIYEKKIQNKKYE